MNKILLEALKQTRQEPGIPLDEIAKIFCEVFAEAEIDLFIKLLEIERKKK